MNPAMSISSISLRKGQKVPLAKPDGGVLTAVRMGLGWDAVARRGWFGRSRTQPVDLDASCLLFDASGNLVDAVWFRQLHSKDGAVRHNGDNLTGEGDGDDEVIDVDLVALPGNIAQLVFTVNSFTGQDFSQIAGAFCRLVDQASGQELARYDLTGSGPHTAQIMAKVARDGAGWSMTAIGATAAGRTFQHLLPAVVEHL
jgi:tellurium resistance protein TerZ